ncbi:hypothetical protein ACFLU6_00020 [Acidobacteriota bacterium]
MRRYLLAGGSVFACILLTLCVMVPGAQADPCCLNLMCEDQTPSNCANQGGIEGYCIIGQACGAAGCDDLLIQPIQGIKSEKTNGDADIRFEWNPDPNADAYNTYYVFVKTNIQVPGSYNDVLGSTPSTIPGALHMSAVPGTGGTIHYYQVIGDCHAVAQPGACCYPSGACVTQMRVDCEAAGGTFQGDGTDCASFRCGACCIGDGSCMPTDDANCIAQNGDYQGAGTPCNPNPCPQPGACCLPSTGCVDGMSQNNCTLQGGAFQGPLTVCGPFRCNCCVNGMCDAIPEPQCSSQGGVPGSCMMGNPCGGCCNMGMCEVLPATDCTIAGGLPGICMEGIPCGTCCTNGSCADLSEPDCINGGGLTGICEDGMLCGNCCLTGICEDRADPACSDEGGYPMSCGMVGMDCQ